MDPTTGREIVSYLGAGLNALVFYQTRKYRLDPEVSARERRIIEEKEKLKTKIKRTAITGACFLTALVGVGVGAWYLGRRSAQKDLR